MWLFMEISVYWQETDRHRDENSPSKKPKHIAFQMRNVQKKHCSRNGPTFFLTQQKAFPG